MKSMQTKLTLTISLILLTAMSVLGGLNYWKARDILVEDVTKAMHDVALTSADEIGDWMDACKIELAAITLAPAIKSGKAEDIVPYLIYVGKENKRYENMAYIMPDGTFYDNGGNTGNLSQREYFKKAMQGEAAVSDPVISRATGKMVTVVAVPVKTDGKVTGVLFGTIGMEDILKKISAIKAGQTGYAYVLQADGLVVIHPDKEIAMKANAVKDEGFPKEFRSVNERIVKGEAGVAEYEYAGTAKMVAFAPVRGGKWFLAINVPAVEMSGAVSSLTVISLTTIIVVLLLTSLVIVWMARRIARPIQALEEAANRIAEGDISQTELKIVSNDEIGRLGRSFEQMVENLRNLIQKINGATEQVAASSQELTASSEQSAQAANQIAASITDVASGASEQMDVANEATVVVEKMSASIQQMAANAGQVADHTARAAEKAKLGDKTVKQAVAQMNQIETTVTDSAQVVAKLGDRSTEIGQIVDTISDIAGQTNLLALNAAIEAARAGEQGRGFAVVAEEVRKLAEESQDAAKRIAELIGEIQGDTDKAVVAMDNGTKEVKTGAEVVNHAGAAFREIADLVSEVSGQVREISAAMQQMAVGSRHIVDAVKKIDSLGRKSAGEAQGVSAAAEEQLASMEEISSSSQELAKLAQDLQAEVTKFKL